MREKLCSIAVEYNHTQPSISLAICLLNPCNTCRIANAMATSGREWGELVAFNNSGTYCNQYMVVDLKLFRPGEELQPDLLWVIEQVPHLL